jgi:hypothetical protein
MGFSLFGLKKIAESIGETAAELLDYVSRPIRRVVVNHENRPVNRGRENGQGQALESFLKQFAAIIRT